MTKKNVAICFSGAIRTFHVCKASILKHIINVLKINYNVYLFGHFWYLKSIKNLGTSTMKWKEDNLNNLNVIKGFGFTKFVCDEYTKDYEKLIQDGCNTEIIINNKSTKDKDYIFSAVGMYYKILKCNQLKMDYANNNNITFDYCIRMRPDFCWLEPIPNNIFDNIKDNMIILQKDKYCINAKWNSNDKFFAGTDTMMNNYCNLYNEIFDYYKQGVIIEGQNLAKQRIINMNLIIRFFGTDSTYFKITKIK